MGQNCCGADKSEPELYLLHELQAIKLEMENIKKEKDVKEDKTDELEEMKKEQDKKF